VDIHTQLLTGTGIAFGLFASNFAESRGTRIKVSATGVFPFHSFIVLTVSPEIFKYSAYCMEFTTDMPSSLDFAIRLLSDLTAFRHPAETNVNINRKNNPPVILDEKRAGKI